MEATTAARIFHDWAATEGLMPDGAVAEITSSAAEIGLIDPITEAGKQLLRSKYVQAVGFNNSSHEVVVFTKRAAPVSKKMLKMLPSAVDDVGIKYRQGVQNPVGGTPTQPFGSPPFTVRNVGGVTHYTCGSSISVGNCRDAGTLSCLVRDAHGQLYGLSNNHVSGSCSFANIGLPILAPGVLDVAANSLPPFTLGFHHAALPLVSGSPDNVTASANLDAAIFRVMNASHVSSYQGHTYDTPTATLPLAADMEVEKVGRTTGHTRGKVISQLHGAHPIRYEAAIYGFHGIVCFDPVFTIVGHTTAFSDNGDSGSLITTVDAAGVRHAVGIVVGGMNDGSAPGGKTTIALPIEPILAGLGVTLVAGHNV